MATQCGPIELLVMRIQNDFLTKPALTLTIRDAQRRFGLDHAACEAVLGVLVEARVLEKTERGEYLRFFPRSTARDVTPPNPAYHASLKAA